MIQRFTAIVGTQYRNLDYRGSFDVGKLRISTYSSGR